MKCSELSAESIPGCVLQCYVILTSKDHTGISAFVSIGICALTTGFTSALITFDMDVSVSERKNQPAFYGFLPDDHAKRGRCFFLMMIISTFHNLSRSIGLALLAASGWKTAVYFVGGEIYFYLALKIARRDFMYWLPIEGATDAFISLIERMIAKVIVDFSGCLQLRHPCEMGGLAFSLSMLWVSV